jgi:hypothetical protein
MYILLTLGGFVMFIKNMHVAAKRVMAGKFDINEILAAHQSAIEPKLAHVIPRQFTKESVR